MERLRDFAREFSAESPVHRLDPRTKIVALLAYSILVVIFRSAAPLLMLLLFVLIGHLLAKPPLSRLLMLLLLILLAAWGTVFSQALFYASEPRTVLLTLIPRDFPLLGRITGGLYIYREGFRSGLVQSLRFSSMLCLGLLVTWTTEAGSLIEALSRLRIPYRFSFMAATAFRFIPIILSEASNVIAAQRLRGARFFRRPGLVNLKLLLNMLRPIFANTISRSVTLAHSLLARGFDPTRERTHLRTLKFTKLDYLLISLLLSSCIFSVGAKALLWLWAEGIFYASFLRPLYAFVRQNL